MSQTPNIRSTATVLVAMALALGAAVACNYHHPKAGGEGENGLPLTDPTVGGGQAAFPVLMNTLFGPKCTKCHNPGSARAGVDATSFGAIAHGHTQGGEPLIVAANPDASALFRAVASGDMPPGGVVDAATLAMLRCWIEQGATEDGGAQCVASDAPQATPAPKPTPRPSAEPTATPTAGPTDSPTPSGAPTAAPMMFEDGVSKVLEDNCTMCHDGTPGYEVDLRTVGEVMSQSAHFGPGSGPDRAALVVPGDPAASVLWRVLETDTMPDGYPPITPEEKAIVKKWIEEGAHHG
jgi:uncharacterized membrane protein